MEPQEFIEYMYKAKLQINGGGGHSQCPQAVTLMIDHWNMALTTDLLYMCWPCLLTTISTASTRCLTDP